MTLFQGNNKINRQIVYVRKLNERLFVMIKCRTEQHIAKEKQCFMFLGNMFFK